MKQIVYLNYIKIIAIIFVLIYHSEVTNDIYSSAFLSMCCPLFFVVNGYLMLRKEHSLAYLLRNNAKISCLSCFGVVYVRVLIVTYRMSQYIY